MQFSNKTIIYNLALLIMLPLFLGSCLKKVEGIDEINSNIFDREYTGDVWYIVQDIEQVTNDLGQIKSRFRIWIPKANLPGLVPSNIKIHTSGDGLDVTVIDFPLTPGGDFERSIDLPYTGTGEYCITLGIYNEEENAAINLFETCKTL
ncbi:MAG: hypothetical protein ACI8ZM_003023 [Crocinitomix sp.]|jgi:hypothetical protein